MSRSTRSLVLSQILDQPDFYQWFATGWTVGFSKKNFSGYFLCKNCPLRSYMSANQRKTTMMGVETMMDVEMMMGVETMMGIETMMGVELGHYRMSFEFPSPVKKIAVSSQPPAYEGIADGLCYIDHFRVEISDPLHFIVGIIGLRLDHFC